jgi:hypothetical protein
MDEQAPLGKPPSSSRLPQKGVYPKEIERLPACPSLGIIVI